MSDLTGAVWKKSIRSSASNSCVEVAKNLPSVVGVRDSKDPQGGALAVAPDAFTAFLGLVKENGVDAS